MQPPAAELYGVTVISTTVDQTGTQPSWSSSSSSYDSRCRLSGFHIGTLAL